MLQIKYKKCRLRPGAVPIRNFHSINNLLTDKDSLSQQEIDIKNLTPRKEVSEENEIFLIPRRKKSDNEDAENENTNVHYHTYSKSQDYNSEENDDLYVQLSRDMNKEDISTSIHDSKLKKLKSEIKESVKTLKCDNNYSPDFIEVMTESMNEDKRKTQISSKVIRAKKFNKAIECSIKRYDSSSEDETSKTLQDNIDSIRSYSKKKSMKNKLRICNDLCINNRELVTLNYSCLDMQNKIFDAVSENEILFEDFLEVCTEVSIPHGWSCLVTSKGHGTTVVYLYMGITKDGLPFVEKQGFIRSDMVLHCAVANREIDPLMHNLVKERKMRNLLDIEIFIDEFDQRVICQGKISNVFFLLLILNNFFFPQIGIHDRKNFEDFDITKVAYEDGIRWRHVSCSLIINNNSSRCTKCAKLSYILNKS